MNISYFRNSIGAITLALLCMSDIVQASTNNATTNDQYDITQLTEDEAYQLGLDAYSYMYPLITMDITRSMLTSQPEGTGGKGPANEFHHLRSYPDANFKEVVRPNFDTLYSIAWLDLTKEPQIVSAPDTNGRYYLLPMLDMWSNVFAAPGKRTSGTGAGHWAIVPPGWKGKVPDGVETIVAPTPYVWVLGRTQTNGPSDYPAVHAIQDGYKITPLSLWGNKQGVAEPTIIPHNPWINNTEAPLVQVNKMDAKDYFTYGSQLLQTNPPQVTDWSILARLKRLGIGPGLTFEFEKLPKGIQLALQRSVHDALVLMKKSGPSMVEKLNGWVLATNSIGVYGNDYLKRAIVALVGLGANMDVDAVYPVLISDVNGNPLEGGKHYVIKFDKNMTPPTNAFWSITMYDRNGFPIANPLNRYAISSWMPLKKDQDGSISIYMQPENPGKEKESNWLPSSADGRLGVTMRVYWPKSYMLDGGWAPPAVTPVN
ncbi:DUF1254 domain-containing protein [Enterobacter ludwigii]